MSIFGRSKQHQRGVGLIEVMVSLLLLAVAVLGYVALQSTALSATDESITKTNIITLVRDVADRIRYNPSVMDEYQAELKDFGDKFEASGATAAPTPDCQSAACTAMQQAAADSYIAAQKAYASGYRLAMVVCPAAATGIMQTRCLIGSWGSTTPTLGADSDPNDGTMDCIDDSDGNYHRGSECLILEVQ